MSTRWGRISRVIGGILMMAAGLFVIGGGLGFAIAAGSLLPIATGLFNICPISPFYGLPLRTCPVPARRQ
ncbi:MAG TPA: DUF2892 domain-containing protein [Thermomicrobiales bacterium]|nr:DUF2892 domain-containing protein [Thermomicrobiales bacterium]